MPWRSSPRHVRLNRGRPRSSAAEGAGRLRTGWGPGPFPRPERPAPFRLFFIYYRVPRMRPRGVRERRPGMEIQSYIRGEWIVPRSKRTVRNVNPANVDEVISEFPSAGEEETSRAVDAAREAFPAWREMPAPERGRFVTRVAEMARQRQD
ncbi:MAG: aldehyde dehydrogenase family protein, partial [Synergistales bacterium]|nr:aldehyde dehydrogenase family protein [Synergistales bacterium]